MTNFALLALQALASASSVFQCLSPMPSIYNAHKAKSTGELSIFPLVSLLGVCHIWMMYGYLSGDIFPLCLTYLFGDVVAILYVMGFYKYTTERAYALKVIAAAGSALLLVTLYVVLGKIGATHQPTDRVSEIIGFIGIAMSIILYASPLETIRRVISTKSASSIPILLCIAGTVSNALWAAYGLIIVDYFVIIPNSICLVLASTQVILYVIYNPNKQPVETVKVDLEKDAGNGIFIDLLKAFVAPRAGHLYHTQALSEKLEVSTPRAPHLYCSASSDNIEFALGGL